jgi:hypothetical protein
LIRSLQPSRTNVNARVFSPARARLLWALAGPESFRGQPSTGSDPPSLRLWRGREVIGESEWLTEFLTGGTLFVSWIEPFIDEFFLSPGG